MKTYIGALLGCRSSDEGATAVEYGIMVALIAVVIIGAVWALGGELLGIFDEAATEVGANRG
jgi:pilus assembly protein Flp/PilA